MTLEDLFQFKVFELTGFADNGPQARVKLRFLSPEGIWMQGFGASLEEALAQAKPLESAMPKAEPSKTTTLKSAEELGL